MPVLEGRMGTREWITVAYEHQPLFPSSVRNPSQQPRRTPTALFRDKDSQAPVVARRGVARPNRTQIARTKSA